MELNDEELDAVYSHAELYVKLIFEGLKAGNIDDVLEDVADRILDEVPSEYEKEVLTAINKHINYRDMLLPMLDIGYSDKDANLEWEYAIDKLNRLLR